MFKNLIIYRTSPLDFTLDQLESALQKSPFIECGATEEKSMGWVPPRGEAHGALVESIGGQWIARLMIETKAVPGDALVRKVKEKAERIEQETGRKPGKKERRELKEEARLDLLPMAFTKRGTTWVWIDPQTCTLVIDTSSQARADEVVSTLVWPPQAPLRAMHLTSWERAPSRRALVWRSSQHQRRNLTQLLGQMAGAMGAAFTFRELVTAAAQMESMREGLRAVSGSAEQAGRDLEFVRTVANRVGADVVQVGQAYLGLAAATKGTAVEGEPTRQVFEAVATAMGKAGKSASETQNALVALAQMASKGTVSMEELRGQLGEALPGALQAASNGLGITTQDLIKLVENGQIAASDLFPALSKGLNDLYGGAPAAQTLSQEITNIKNAFTGMADRIGEAGGLRALKVGAEIAQAAVVLLGEGLVATGQKIGVLLGAIATLDFSGVKQAFADIEAEARKNLLNAAQHNDVLRASLGAVGNDATQAALAQQQLGSATQQAGAAAAASSPTWVKLASDYGKVLESVREQILLQSRRTPVVVGRWGWAAQFQQTRPARPQQCGRH